MKVLGGGVTVWDGQGPSVTSATGVTQQFPKYETGNRLKFDDGKEVAGCSAAAAAASRGHTGLTGVRT